MTNRDSIEELRKKFIVDEGQYVADRLQDDVEKLLRYCKISKQGRVLITKRELTDKKKVGLVVFARYIGNKLDNAISELVIADEIATYTGIEKASVNARGKELVDDGFLSRPEAATYKVNPSKIQDFVDLLEA